MVRSEAGLAYEMMEMYRANNRVSDSLDIRIFKTWVQQARAQILKQRFDEPMSIIDNHVTQDLGKVEFAPVDSSTELTIPSGKYIMRSVKIIPSTINSRGKLATFTRIAPVDFLEKKFNLISQERAYVSGNGKFNQNDVYVFLSGGYLYLISKTNIAKYIKYVNIRGVFANPKEAYEFDGTKTWNETTTEYPVSESVVMDMINMIIDKKFKLVMNQIEDKNSNGADDTTVTNVKK